MPFDSSVHHRHSIRLKDFDYTQAGGYFVTLVTAERKSLFGDLSANGIILNPSGECAATMLGTLPSHFPVKLDEWIIMPDHIHFILNILGSKAESRQPDSPNPTRDEDHLARSYAHGTSPGSLGAMVQYYKSATSRRINALRRTPGAPVWQRNYYEHVIRDEADYHKIVAYIRDNWIEH